MSFLKSKRSSDTNRATKARTTNQKHGDRIVLLTEELLTAAVDKRASDILFAYVFGLMVRSFSTLLCRQKTTPA